MIMEAQGDCAVARASEVKTAKSIGGRSGLTSSRFDDFERRRPRDSQSSAKPQVRVASSEWDLKGAFRLVYEEYLRAGLISRNRHQMRMTPYHLLPTTDVFVAVERQRVVCTMTLIRDGHLGLPMEEIFAPEVARRRRFGRQVAEVSCLADCRLDRPLPVLIRLIGFMFQFALKKGVDDLVIAVHPHHADFYERFIGFTTIGEERSYQTVGGKPAVALALDLDRLHATNSRSHQRFFKERYPSWQLRAAPISPALMEEMELIVGAVHGLESRSQTTVQGLPVAA